MRRRPTTPAGWLSRERVLALALLAATVLALYVCYRLARPFLPALAWAVALAVLAHPLHAALLRRVPRPALAAGMTVLLVAVMVVAPTVFVVQQLVGELAGWAQRLQEILAPERWQELLRAHPRLAPLLEWGRSVIGAPEAAQDAARAQAPTVLATTAWAVADVLIALFALFYFLRDRDAVLAAVRGLVPLPERETQAMFRLVSDTIRATVFGSLVVAAVQGALGGVMFWWIGLPSALLWGTMMALLAIVPTLGAFVVWLPTAVYLAATGSPGRALILGVWGLLVVSLVDNLLYPVLVGSRMRIHTLPVFLAILGGLLLFGAAGLILGPMTLAVTLALVGIWRRRTAFGRTAEGTLAEELPGASARAATPPGPGAER